MGRFEDLAYNQNIGDQSAGVLTKFGAYVQEGPFNLWSLGQPIVADGRRLLIGAAIWSVYDLRLLDTLEDAFCAGRISSDRIDVFEMNSLRDWIQINDYIPGLEKVYQPPVVGLWTQNRLVASYEGAFARDFVLSMYGLTMSVEYKWLNSDRGTDF